MRGGRERRLGVGTGGILGRGGGLGCGGGKSGGGLFAGEREVLVRLVENDGRGVLTRKSCSAYSKTM
jgi:hypothetical protein